MGREHAKRANDTSFQPPKRRPVRPARHLDVSLEERKKLEHRQQGAINLESRFCHLPAELAAYWRASLVTETFTRPLPPSAAQLLREQVDGSGAPLICPRRPKWHRDATKLHVESNEAALHKVWLRDLDAALAGNQEGGPGHDGSHEKEEWTYDATNGGDGQGEPMNGGDGQGEPTFVERNLEVWRQLWRVGEASDVLCALADCRFPLLHLPASLLSYLRTLKPARPVLLVLTKCDLVSEDVVEAWQAYYQRECPDFRILCVESYQDGDRGRTVAGTTSSQREAFIEAVYQIHRDLCTPHPRVAEDPVKLAVWQPRVSADVDWSALGVKAASGRNGEYTSKARSNVKPYFSVGLIGQPNVGKSSLMNALLGRKAVRASRTPGKTKHLQTHFWTNDIRLCDCPGLVCPSRAGLRRQVLAGVIPIQATEAVIAYVSSLLPLERILHLPVAKTTDDLLVAYAERNKYVTAKAGRADTSRAAAEIIRKLQGGAIRWAFRPPESLVDAGEGVWLGGETGDLDEEVEEGAEEEPSRPATPSEEGRSESESDSESEEEEAERQGASNAFALLSVVDA